MAASKNPLVRLVHIRDEIDALTAAFDGVTYEAFVTSYVLKRTAEHAVLIISEAARSLDQAVTAPYPVIDWRAIRDVGNILRHEYFSVDPRVPWRIVNHSLPELRPVIQAMIEALTR
ncbi:MAG TPA: HepT-like ribonuclease domain-containing protein [Lichenihabitans sp.]|nr:HepT-like ribonuclease domain-containing protein [Lichenihabitans sp.]